jgi:2,3-diketo-5-methylthio-1-phosphopentane phosphatase
MSENLSYIVFTDFDGTIAVNDIGDAMFEHFGDVKVCTESFEQYRAGKIDARDCWRKGFASIPSATKDDFAAFTSFQAIDLHFKTFVDFCSEKNIVMSVLSDGYDAYIDPVLKRENLDWLPVYSNRLQYNVNGTVEPIFPFTDAECKQCANCKRNHILTKSSDNNVIVYIGDGISDRCPVKFADIVFAKDSLVSFCETHNITFHRFENFADVLKTFRTIVETKKPRKRRTAELARKEVYMME